MKDGRVLVWPPDDGRSVVDGRVRANRDVRGSRFLRLESGDSRLEYGSQCGFGIWRIESFEGASENRPRRERREIDLTGRARRCQEQCGRHAARSPAAEFSEQILEEGAQFTHGRRQICREMNIAARIEQDVFRSKRSCRIGRRVTQRRRAQTEATNNSAGVLGAEGNGLVEEVGKRQTALLVHGSRSARITPR